MKGLGGTFLFTVDGADMRQEERILLHDDEVRSA